MTHFTSFPFKMSFDVKHESRSLEHVWLHKARKKVVPCWFLRSIYQYGYIKAMTGWCIYIYIYMTKLQDHALTVSQHGYTRAMTGWYIYA